MNTYEANQALGFDMDQRDYGVGAQIQGELVFENAPYV